MNTEFSMNTIISYEYEVRGTKISGLRVRRTAKDIKNFNNIRLRTVHGIYEI